MLDHFALAYEAIESYVEDECPSDSNKWQPLVPETEWGMTLEAWLLAASDIVARFNKLIRTPISVPRQAKVNVHGRRLIEFQRYLAAKADAAAGTQLIKRMER